MKLFRAAVLALSTAVPAVASATAFSINFEQNWDYFQDIGNAYSGQGVSFTNVFGLSNDPSFTYYFNAPSPLGTAATSDTAFLNVASGVSNALSFFYSTPTSITGSITAYSLIDGGGVSLGTVNLTRNDLRTFTDVDGTLFPIYDTWTQAILQFSGTARSFRFSGASSAALFDNIATVPEPGTMALLFAGAATAIGLRRRR